MRTLFPQERQTSIGKSHHHAPPTYEMVKRDRQLP